MELGKKWGFTSTMQFFTKDVDVEQPVCVNAFYALSTAKEKGHNSIDVLVTSPSLKVFVETPEGFKIQVSGPKR